MPEGITSGIIFTFAADYLRIQRLAAAIPTERNTLSDRQNK